MLNPDKTPQSYPRSYETCRFWSGTKGSCPTNEMCNSRHELRHDGQGREAFTQFHVAKQSCRAKDADMVIDNVGVKGNVLSSHLATQSYRLGASVPAVTTSPPPGSEERSSRRPNSRAVCRKWIAMRCTRGDGCPFRHVRDAGSVIADSPLPASSEHDVRYGAHQLTSATQGMSVVNVAPHALPDPISSGNSTTSPAEQRRSITSNKQFGFCWDWQRGECNRSRCHYKHENPPPAYFINPFARFVVGAAPEREDSTNGRLLESTPQTTVTCQQSKPRHNTATTNVQEEVKHGADQERRRQAKERMHQHDNIKQQEETRMRQEEEAKQQREEEERKRLEEELAEERKQAEETRVQEEQRRIEELQKKERREQKKRRQAERRLERETRMRQEEEAKQQREEEKSAEERKQAEEVRVQEEQRRIEEELQKKERREQQKRRKEEHRLERQRRQEEARLGREEEMRRKEEARLAAEQRMTEALRKETERLANEAREARWREQTLVTLQSIVNETSLVTYGAGLAIQRVVAGFDLCRLEIKGLPLDASHDEVMDIFIQQGVAAADCFLLPFKRVRNKLEAMALVNAEDGKAIAFRLNGIEFRQHFLSFEVWHEATDVTTKGPPILTISWRGRKVMTVTLVADYFSRAEAERQAKRMDGAFWNGYKIKATLDVNKLSSKVTLTNCAPATASEQSTTSFTRTWNVVAPNLLDWTDEEAVLESVRENVVHMAGSLRDTLRVDPPKGKEGQTKLTIHFDTWDNLKRAHSFFNGAQLSCTGGTVSPILRAWHLTPTHYSCVIPNCQFYAQRQLWDNLTQRAPGVKAWVHVRAGDQGDVQIVEVQGDDKVAAGALKVRAEALCAGKTLHEAYWHSSFLTLVGQRFLDRVYQETKTHVRSDFKTHTLRIYGDGEAVEAAQRMIREEVKRKAAEEMTWTIHPPTAAFFVREGLGRLKELIGDNNATMQLARRPAIITVKGGEVARHHVQRLIEESQMTTGLLEIETDGEATCPVCCADTTNPEQLDCGHTYCAGCLQHLFSSAIDTKTFPLVCMGNDATCNSPISIPFLRRFTQPQAFQALIDVAFAYYLEQHPEELKYCATPDCRQVYRLQNLATRRSLECPGCFQEICSACGTEPHGYMSCEENRLLRESGEEERRSHALMAENGYKKCPRCTAWMEKTEGCNHVKCMCGGHICWRCLAVFETDFETYEHLNVVHGGYDDAPALAGPNPYGEADALPAAAYPNFALQRMIEEERQELANRYQAEQQQATLRRQQEGGRWCTVM